MVFCVSFALFAYCYIYACIVFVLDFIGWLFFSYYYDYC